MKPFFNISLSSVLRCIDDMWEHEFKRLHNDYPLRYGHCCIWTQVKETSPTGYEYKSIISILCTEKQAWSSFLDKIEADATDKAVWCFLFLLLLYRSPSGYDISFDALSESSKILLEDLKPTEKDRIPELVLARLISNDNQGDPDDPLSVFFEPSYDIVVNFIEATVIRVLKKLASWAMVPYEVVEHKFEENSFRDFLIESQYESEFYEFLPRVCYGALVMGELFKWDKDVSFWNFLELKIQGVCCSVNNIDSKGDFIGIKSNNSGYFKNGSILWKELNGRKILRTRFEAKLICAQCGGMLQHSALAPLSLDASLGDDEDSNFSLFNAIAYEGENEWKQKLASERNNDQDWFCIHESTCGLCGQSKLNEYFLVSYDDYLYFPDMYAKEPYQIRICVQCEECTEKYQNKIDKSKRCVWPENTDNKCGVCGSQFGGKRQKTFVPVHSYVPSYASDHENTEENNDPSLRNAVCVFLKDFYPIDDNFEETARKIGENKDKFEDALSCFCKSWKLRISTKEFKKRVKAILIAQEFYRCCFPGEKVDDLACLRELFGKFWKSDFPVKNALGSAVKERAQKYVEKEFLCFEQN